MNQPPGFRRPFAQHGATLIEVLVTLLIVSIGLLGLAGLQMSGLRSNNSAYMRTQATLQAYDIIDRMRSNKAGADAGGYVFDPASDSIPSQNCSGVGATCNSTQMAQHDLRLWLLAMASPSPSGYGCPGSAQAPDDVCRRLLPAGTGRINRDNATGLYTVTVLWDDYRTGVTGTGCDPDRVRPYEQTGVTPTDLLCFTVSLIP